MKRFFVILLVLLLAACGGKEADPPTDAPGLFVAHEGGKARRVLVLPFTCEILPEKHKATAIMLQNQLAAQVIYMLQGAGIPAEQYVPGTGGSGVTYSTDLTGARQAPGYAVLLPEAYSTPGAASPVFDTTGTPGAATQFEEVTDWDTVVVPPRDVRQFGAPLPYAVVTETEYAAPPGQPEAGFFEQREKILKEAREAGYDYVLSGVIALVRTDISPTVRLAGSERATVRSEINCTTQLVETDEGKVLKAVAARGRDARMVAVQNGVLGNYHLQSTLDRVMHRATSYAARIVAENIADKKLDEAFFLDELEDDAVYYQDTPGKRLRSVGE